MIQSVFLPIVISTLLCFFSGLGVGGGSLLILWLTFVDRMAPDVAKAVNLICFLPAASIACIHNVRVGAIRIQTIWPAILGGCISGAFFALVSSDWDLQWLRSIYGFFLILVGLRELTQKKEHP